MFTSYKDALSNAVTTVPDTVTSVLLVVLVTFPSSTVNVVVVITSYPSGAMVSLSVYVPLGRSILNCSSVVFHVIVLFPPETATSLPPDLATFVKSTSPVVLSCIVAPVSSLPLPVISFLLKVTVVGLGASNAVTVRPSGPLNVTVSSDVVSAFSVTFPSFIVNVDLVIVSYSLSPILSVAVSSRVYSPSGRLILRAWVPDVHVIDWPFAVIAGPLTRAFAQSTVVPAAAVSFMDAPGSSDPLFIMSCLLIETS